MDISLYYMLYGLKFIRNDHLNHFPFALQRGRGKPNILLLNSIFSVLLSVFLPNHNIKFMVACAKCMSVFTLFSHLPAFRRVHTVLYLYTVYLLFI